MTKVHNFSAGPSILPQEAIEESIEGLRNFKNSGIPVVSVSHRSPEWEEQMKESKQMVKDLLNVPDNYEILFMQGGASLQFCMVPYNLLSESGKAYYLNTGSWAKKAIKEAKIFGNVEIAGSSEDQNFNYIPKDFHCPNDAAYLHLTPNNTIFGTQIKEFPNCGCPVVADMSSDIFSRPIDVSKFDLIYAGAQKNLGPAGATLVIVNKDILGKVDRTIPAMLDYNTYIEKDSLYNTPPVYNIYLSYLTLKWLKEQGGLEGIQKQNEKKARIIYDEIDDNPLFEGTAAKEDRSMMNATFVMKEQEMESEFLKYTEEKNIVGVKGHRSVGGFRASIYNAMPKESIEYLAETMREFAKKTA